MQLAPHGDVGKAVSTAHNRTDSYHQQFGQVIAQSRAITRILQLCQQMHQRPFRHRAIREGKPELTRNASRLQIASPRR
jgi:hypothetical protein